MNANKKYKDSVFTLLMEIPAPEFVVLYNGKQEYADKKELRLSEMFIKHGVPNPINLDLTVTVYNINKGRNPELAARSATLKEYEIFVSKVYEYEKTLPKDEALLKAVEDCQKEGVLSDFLKLHAKEVIDMFLREFKLEEAQEVWWRDGVREGKREGMREGKREGMREGIREGSAKATQAIFQILQEQGYDTKQLAGRLPKEFA